MCVHVCGMADLSFFGRLGSSGNFRPLHLSDWNAMMSSRVETHAVSDVTAAWISFVDA